MDKQTFLNELKKRLRVLNKDEIEDIVEEYEGYINEKVSSGKTEKEAIEDFGDFDCLIKEILSAYKINEDYENEIKEKNVIADFLDGVVSFIKNFGKNLSKRSSKDIIKFMFEFIFLLFFIAILRFPVMIIEKAGDMLFGKLIAPFGDVFKIVWKYMIEIIYLILSLVGIFNFIKKRYMEGECINSQNELKKEDKKSSKKKVSENKNANGVSFTKILIMVLKVSLIFVVIPAVFSFLTALALLVIGFILLIQKVPYTGMFLCLVTYLILNYLFLDLSFRFIFDKKLNMKALLITIITSVILFILSVALSFNEVVNTSFVDGLPNSIKLVEKQKKEVYSDNTLLTCDNLYHTSCSYEIDDTLKDKIEAKVSYYDYNYKIDDNLNIKKYENDKFEMKKIYNLVIDGLKERKIYNYYLLNDVNVTIRISSDVKNKMIEKQKEKNCQGYKYCNCYDNITCTGHNDIDD